LGAAWLPHIKSTQVPNVISGVAPIRSLVNLGSGVADLILLPIEQYKEDSPRYYPSDDDDAFLMDEDDNNN
jgi:hypothetical protein